MPARQTSLSIRQQVNLLTRQLVGLSTRKLVYLSTRQPVNSPTYLFIYLVLYQFKQFIVWPYLVGNGY